MQILKYISVLLVLFSNQLFSQVIITDLSENPLIINENKNIYGKNSSKNDTVKLPFRDDFSSSNIFPDLSLWKNKYVFVNGDYPINPYSINVATFDALDDSGRVYRNASTTPFKADFLTSKPIYLKNLVPNDSVYLSFYYQPQGIGNAPEKNDSLVLEFYDKENNKWNWIWSDTGSTYQKFYSRYNKSFKIIIIPIKEQMYLIDSFQFRFYNYASLTNSTLSGMKSNCDQWHVDFIYINTKRKPSDTTYKDIAITKQGTSLLKNYYAMPWRQYKANPVNELQANTDITVCNLDNVVNSCDYHYEILKNNSNIFSSPIENIPSINTFEIKNPLIPILPNPYPLDNNDNAVFDFKKIITVSTANVIKTNDSVSFYQDFNNYYAYDDGNPESGIGLTPANSKLAYKFVLNTPDTLRAVQIYFNATPNNANQRFFKLVVWKSIYPEVVLYTKTGYQPVFGEDYNRYHYYRLDNPLVVSDTFYVGVQQTTDDYLNIGFDLNNNSKDKAFYNSSAKWVSVPYNGAIMMRPVLGSVIPPNASINEISKTFTNISIYPNPVQGNLLYIDIPDVQNKNLIEMQLFDIYGKMLFADKYSNTINVSAYSNGLYLIRLTNTETKETITSKILISK